MGSTTVKAELFAIVDGKEDVCLQFSGCDGVVCLHNESERMGLGFAFNDRNPERFIACLEKLLVRAKAEDKTLAAFCAKIAGPERQLANLHAYLNSRGMRVAKEVISDFPVAEALFYVKSGKLKLREEASFSTPPPILKPEYVKPNDGSGVTRPAKKRVLVVDDSETIRHMLTAILNADPELEVVGEAERPSDVEDLLIKLKPDVIALDIHMPEMDGVTLLEKLLPRYPIPTVMITALSIEQGEQVLRALAVGAVDYIQKPSVGQVDVVNANIRETIRNAANAKVVSKRKRSAVATSDAKADEQYFKNDDVVIAMGASTGGTEALIRVLQGLPSQIPPILIVQHMPPLLSTAFANRLAQLCAFTVREARDGDQVRKGQVLIAPGGKQMRVRKAGKDLVVHVLDDGPVNGHMPSVDVLFDSVADIIGAGAIGVLLTGIGKDGAAGLLRMRHTGAQTLAQDQDSSVVFGMPQAAIEMNATDAVVGLGEVAAKIIEFANKKRKRKMLR